MRKRTIKVVLLVVMGMTAWSCQKEQLVEPQSNVAEVSTVYTMQYAVNGVLHSKTLNNDEELEAFLRQLMDLAHEGATVVVYDSGRTPTVISSKDTVVFRTRDKDEAVAWEVSMVKQGYQVTTYFDTNTNEYVCTAVN